VYSSDIAVLNLVPVFTSADVYTSTNANLGLVPIERARFTYFFDLWLQGVTPKDTEEEFLTTRRFDLSSRLHAIYYREAAGDFRSIPEEEVRENIFLYRAFMNMPLAQKLTTYPVRAVVTTPNDPENSQWSLLLSCTKESFAAQGYTVRLMIPQGEVGSCL